MVVKTSVCNYSDLKIYPGHGVKIISREGKIQIYIHKKARKQAMKKTKPQKIKWTTAWRRVNKKIKNTEATKKKRRRAKKVVRYTSRKPYSNIFRKYNMKNSSKQKNMIIFKNDKFIKKKKNFLYQPKYS